MYGAGERTKHGNFDLANLTGTLFWSDFCSVFQMHKQQTDKHSLKQLELVDVVKLFLSS
jgi:hypothetical protein